MTSVQQAVTAGMAYMDEYHPDWEEHIDLETLEMSKGACCIIGQVFRGSYFEATERLELPFAESELGFVTGWENVGQYPALTREWKRQIKAKRRRT